jgi:UDP-N-acetylglucosamine 2-epimerase (non-hydrolysing)
MENLLLVDPLGYLDFLCLMSDATLMITDSGGIQEETTILGIPCMTLRKNTERPVTIEQGTNRLVPITADAIVRNYRELRTARKNSTSYTLKFWDGKAAKRITKIIIENYESLTTKGL